jgi:hypothetical protein
MSGPAPALRAATAADVAELVRMRRLMMAAMEVPEEPTGVHGERVSRAALAGGALSGGTGLAP